MAGSHLQIFGRNKNHHKVTLHVFQSENDRSVNGMALVECWNAYAVNAGKKIREKKNEINLDL